jgi:signal transduction histidine kinase
MLINSVSIIIWIAAAFQASMGVFIYTATKSRSSRAFVHTLFWNTVWMSTIGLFISAGTVDTATFLVKLAYFSGAMLAETFFFFFLLYPDNNKSYPAIKSMLVVITVGMGYLFFFTNYIIADAYSIGGIARYGWHFGALWFLFPIFFYPFFLCGFILLLYKGLKSDELAIRKSSLLMFWGIMILITLPTIVNVIMPQFNEFRFIWLGPILAITWISVIAYAIINYEALEIKLIAKRAFAYSISVVGIGLITISLNLFNTYLTTTYAGFSPWLLYLISAMIMAGIGYFVWLKIRENDILKYEFINIITHKLRTPLTQIRWSNEEIQNYTTDTKIQQSTERIKTANLHMIELLDSLVNLSDSEKSYLYILEDFSLSVLVEETISKMTDDFQKRNITINKELGSSGKCHADRKKIEFVLQTLLHNALMYSQENSAIEITSTQNKKYIYLTVSDKGIGISKKDLALIFRKFFRTKEAKMANTEGSGIGLFLSQLIIKRSGGSMKVDSQGQDKGTKFTITLPLVRRLARYTL